MTYNFITLANAQETAPAAPQNDFSFTSFVPLVLIFVIFYFLIIRPQSKKMKDHQAMVNALKIGDKIVTSSGIVGVVKEIDEKENIFEVEIAKNTNIKILRTHISEKKDK